MEIVVKDRYRHWIEYQATHDGVSGCTITTSAAEEAKPLPFDTWLWLMVEEIRREHPEATDIKLMRREQIHYPPAEVIRDL